MSPLRRLACGLLLLGAACGANLTGPELAGQWGGPEAIVTLAPSGGTIQYSCAEGTIDPSWTLSSGGRWRATGQHFTGGGPVPPGGHPPHPAIYSGTVRGNQLTFTVTLTDLDQVLGPYTVTKGRSSHMNLCL
ncbi:MAG: hypothetical protein ACHQ2E_06490 [Gemmatimonadales bacterium]